MVVQGVQDDQQAVAERSEWDGASDGFADAVSGFSDAEEVSDVEKRDLNGPAGGVAGDDLLR